MDQDTADSSTHALTKLALLAAELNTRANLADVTASVGTPTPRSAPMHDPWLSSSAI
jgi:hypothetical protein